MGIDWAADALAEFGVYAGAVAPVRMARGSAFGFTRGAADVVRIALYSPDESQGLLMYVLDDHSGSLVVLRKGFRVSPLTGAWATNGGDAAFDADARDLAKSPERQVRIPRASKCRVE
jgi:hypothetical protein